MCLPQSRHGGSMRYVFAASSRPARPCRRALPRRGAQGLELGLHLQALQTTNCEKLTRRLDDLAARPEEAGQTRRGYGATSKSTTVTNYCGITPDLVDFISDTTPIKQGKLSPGAHIPVRPVREVQSQPARLRAVVRLEPRRRDLARKSRPSWLRAAGVIFVRAQRARDLSAHRMILGVTPRRSTSRIKPRSTPRFSACWPAATTCSAPR